MRELRVNAALDKDYLDGEVMLHLLLDAGNAAKPDQGGRASSKAQPSPEIRAREDARPPESLSLVLKLQDPAGKVVKQSLLTSAATELW